MRHPLVPTNGTAKCLHRRRDAIARSESYACRVEPMTAAQRVPPRPPNPPAPPIGGDRPPPGDPRGPSRTPRFSLLRWLREARGEMRRVAQPTRSSVVHNSTLVVVVVIIVVAAIAAFDIGVSRAVTALFG